MPPADHSRGSGAAARVAGLAVLVLLLAALLWLRGTPRFLGWQVARDHEQCFGRAHLRARLWTTEPWEARNWLEARGTAVPPLPARAGGVTLVGVRYCPLVDRIGAHLYYGGEQSHVSVFVLSGPARIGDGWQGKHGELSVRLLRSAGRTLAIVGRSRSDVEAVTRFFGSLVARNPPVGDHGSRRRGSDPSSMAPRLTAPGAS